MAEAADIRIAELLCARLCHELVGPVGAIGNGLELIAELGNRMDREVFNVLGTAGNTAARRLAFYRIAYGSGASLPAAGRMVEVRRLIDGLAEGGRVVVEWPATARVADTALGLGAVKLLLNLFVVASDSLPRGGTVGVTPVASGGQLNLTFDSRGAGARVEAPYLEAINGAIAVDRLDPRNVHAYFAGRLARDIAGSTPVIAVGPDKVSIALAVKEGV